MDAIVFLVDAVDRDRFSESKRELDGLLSDEALAKVLPIRTLLQHTFFFECLAKLHCKLTSMP